MAENNLDDLITYIGIEVYGREMRGHIQNALRLLAQSSLTAEEKAKIADSILYTPQTLNDDQKQIARSNIGAAKAGDSGRGWTEEQIGLFEDFKDELETVFERIGYKDNSAEGPGQTAAGAAIEKLEELIESLRTIPRELESVTLAVNVAQHVSGQDITNDDLVVTCHYSVGPDEVITDGYTIDPEKWQHPYTNVKVTYNGVVSNPVLVPVAEPPAATISIDDASDTTHLKVTVNLGTEQITVSKGNPYLLYEADKSKSITITLQVESTQSGKYVIDDSTEVTMTDGSFLKTGTIYTASSITGDIVIKAISKALPERINAAYEGGTVPAGTTLAQLTGITVTATYYDENVVTLTSGQYELSGTLTPGQANPVTVEGNDEYDGLTDTFEVSVEAAPVETTATATADATGTISINQFTVTLDKKLNTVRKIEVRGTKGVAGTTILNADFEKQNGNWVCTDFELTNGLTLAKVSSVVFRSGYTLTVGEASGKTTVSVPSLHYVSTTGAEANTLYGSAGNPYTFTVYGTI